MKLPVNRMASPWSMPGARGILGGIGASASGMFSSIAGRIGKATGFAFGSSMWGVAAAGKSRSFLGAIGRRAIGPGLILGAFGIAGAAKGLLGGGYSMDGPDVARGYTPGISDLYQNNPMTFTNTNRVTPDLGATGALAFALHNQRKA